MKIFILPLIVILGLVIVIMMFRREKGNPSVKQNTVQLINSNKNTAVKDSSENFQILFKMLPETRRIDETKLVEIKDSKILARVNNLVPGFFQAGTMAGNVIHNNTKVLFEAILPAGAKLAQSKDMPGAVRGIFHGVEGVKGHANFVMANNTANTVANAAAATMGVASMIVGQYYMTQINDELSTISEGISRIADFQNNEYKSKVFALVTQIKRISSFKAEILENNELRATKIIELNNLEQQNIELLGQANLTIAGYSKKRDISFNQYEEELAETQNWYMYQRTLLDVLFQIADLKYTLHLGTVSREECSALLSTYSSQVNDSVTRLTKWHKSQTEKHGINTDVNIRKRIGFDGLIHKLPGMIKEEYKFRPLSEETADIITAQVNGNRTKRKAVTVDLFQQDVKLIVKEGRLYYLPQNDIVQATAL